MEWQQKLGGWDGKHLYAGVVQQFGSGLKIYLLYDFLNILPDIFDLLPNFLYVLPACYLKIKVNVARFKDI